MKRYTRHKRRTDQNHSIPLLFVIVLLVSSRDLFPAHLHFDALGGVVTPGLVGAIASSLASASCWHV